MVYRDITISDTPLMALEGDFWTPPQKELWARIEGHDFEPSQPLNFTARLARDRGWTLDGARAAIDAYRRFCFLAAVSPSPVTPSEAVDEVWHQHLIYSRDYWDAWCGQALRKPLHHDPTPGGSDAQRRYRQQYAQTLALHEQYFGPPPAGLWPATHERFGRKPQFRIVDRARWFVLPRPDVTLRRILLK
jgi:hypothetical protein